MKEIITPTEAGGTLKVWAEFRPTQTRSNVLQFHVVGDSDKPKVISDPDKPKAKKAKPGKSRIGAAKNSDDAHGAASRQYIGRAESRHLN